jgi:hypothetical protein
MSSVASSLWSLILKFLHAMQLRPCLLGAASSGAEVHGCLGEALKIWQSVQDNGFSSVVAMFSSSRDELQRLKGEVDDPIPPS